MRGVRLPSAGIGRQGLDIVVTLDYTAHMAKRRKQAGRPPLPKGTAKRITLTVKVSPLELRRLKDEARRQRTTVSELLMRFWRA